jgi:hypothetical protein
MSSFQYNMLWSFNALPLMKRMSMSVLKHKNGFLNKIMMNGKDLRGEILFFYLMYFRIDLRFKKKNH